VRLFLFRLALALGKTVAELYRDMDAAELADWIAFARIEPFGGPVDDVRMAMVAAASANSNPYRKKAVQVRDCLPGWNDARAPRQMSMEQMKQVWRSWTRRAK